MKKEYNLVAKLTITTFTKIIASSPEEAILLGRKRRDMMGVTSNNGDSEEIVWMIDELDGEPYDVKIEE